MSDISCNLIQDLMPLYIEGLTRTDTNEYIKKHLSECSECKSFLEDIQYIETSKYTKKEIAILFAKQYIKRIKSKIKY